MNTIYMFWQFHLAVIKCSYKSCKGMFLGRGLPFTNSDYPVLFYLILFQVVD